jgi:ATP-dependent Lhr-like helicase
MSAPAFTAHLLAPQLIAMVIQKGTIAQNTAFDRLNRVAAFREIELSLKNAILHYLISHGFFVAEDGLLLLEDTSQAEFGRKNFLELVSAFTSPPIFTVIQSTRELDTIDQNLLWNAQSSSRSILRLAGHAAPALIFHLQPSPQWLDQLKSGAACQERLLNGFLSRASK